MKRPNAEKLQDLELYAVGVLNICKSLKDPANAGSVSALDYLAGGMSYRVRELSRTWEEIHAGIYQQ